MTSYKYITQQNTKELSLPLNRGFAITKQIRPEHTDSWSNDARTRIAGDG